MKILIIQTAFLGDVILTIPLIRSLKKNLPESLIHILLRPEGKDVYVHDPDIERIIVYDKKASQKGIFNLVRIINSIRENKYDLIISPHRSARSSVISYFSKSTKRIGFDKNALSFLYNIKVNYDTNLHEVGRNLSLLKPLFPAGEKNVLNIYNSGDDKENAFSLISKHFSENDKIVGIAPGSEWNTKRWLPENFNEIINLCSKDDIKVILFGSEKDTGICNKINSGNNVLNVCGKVSINEASELMKFCKVLLCNDTGAMHIAAASGVKIVVIYGPTVPEFGFYPYGVEHKILQKDLYCRPCHIHGGKKCMEKHFRCMKEIKPEMVFKELEKFLI